MLMLNDIDRKILLRDFRQREQSVPSIYAKISVKILNCCSKEMGIELRGGVQNITKK